MLRLVNKTNDNMVDLNFNISIYFRVRSCEFKDKKLTTPNKQRDTGLRKCFRKKGLCQKKGSKNQKYVISVIMKDVKI